MNGINLGRALRGAALTLATLVPFAATADVQRVVPIVEGLNYPSAIAIDAGGKIYVSVLNDDTVRIYAPNGAGGYSDQETLPYLGFEVWPTGVATDAQGAVYVLGASPPAVRKFVPSGTGHWKQATSLTVNEPPFSLAPTGLAVDSSGAIYIADFYGIHKYVPAAEGYDQEGDVAAAPTSVLAFDTHGNLYAAEPAEIVEYPASDSGFGSPRTVAHTHADALAIDGAGDVYAADAANHAVHAFAATASGYEARPDVLNDAAWIPTAVGVDSERNVYVADSASHTLAKFTPGTAGFVRQNDLAHPGSLATPAGVALDRQGNLYVTDINQTPNSGALHKYAATGDGFAAPQDIVPPDHYTPWGVAVDASSNVYVTEIYGEGVHKYTPTPDGGYVEQPMIANDSQFTGIAVDDAGNVYVCDYDGGAVRKYAPAGNGYTRLADVTANAPLAAGNPIGVAVDNAGVVYVTDQYFGTVLVFAPSGAGYTEQIGADGSRGIGNVEDPEGIVVDPAGSVFVSGSNGNYEVSVIHYGQGDTGQATVMTSLLRGYGIFPVGLALDGSGNLYVVDASNNRILRVKSIPGSSATAVFTDNTTLVDVLVSGYQPTGTAQVSVDGAVRCAAVSLDESATNIVGGSCIVPRFAAGKHTISANYGGDVHNTPSSTKIEIEVPRVPVLLLADYTPFPANEAEAVTFNARVRARSGFPLSGKVSFSSNGQFLCETAPLQSASGDASASCVTAVVGAGSVTVTATYGGDAYNDVTSTQTILQVQAGTPFAFDQHGLTGSWYNPATSGQGFEFELYPDLNGSGHGLLFGGWFTFDTSAAGGKRWYALSGDATNSTGAVLQIFDGEGGNFAAPPQVSAHGPLGRAVLALSDCMNGTLVYSFNDGSGRSGRIPLTRLTPNVSCSATGDQGGTSSYLLSGNWYDPATSGQGLMFDFSPSFNTVFGAWYTFKSTGAQQGGPASQNWFTLQSDEFGAGVAEVDGVPIIETSGGVFDAPTPTNWLQVGSAHIVFHSCNSMTLDYRFNAGQNQGLAGSVQLQRAGPVPTGCSL